MRMTGIVAVFVRRAYPLGLRGAVRLAAAVTSKHVLASAGFRATRGFADGPRWADAAAHHTPTADAHIQASTMRHTLYVPGPPRGLLLV
ncbi:hypothetical protein [Candidatus Protofrankia californiensis]|uniref:hypothetical protein n=1 Tax=Candidatus Protofrankia californiensis TaxID=1839754 RepID=UPI00104139EE|nr:hypothetical protein [Candidatus Protofrankia californiensis]